MLYLPLPAGWEGKSGRLASPISSPVARVREINQLGWSIARAKTLNGDYISNDEKEMGLLTGSMYNELADIYFILLSFC